MLNGGARDSANDSARDRSGNVCTIAVADSRASSGSDGAACRASGARSPRNVNWSDTDDFCGNGTINLSNSTDRVGCRRNVGGTGRKRDDTP